MHKILLVNIIKVPNWIMSVCMYVYICVCIQNNKLFTQNRIWTLTLVSLKPIALLSANTQPI